VGPRAGLDAVVKKKIPNPCGDSNPPNIQSEANALLPLSYPGSFGRLSIQKYRMTFEETKVEFRFQSDF
jgi:hypothetical protein